MNGRKWGLMLAMAGLATFSLGIGEAVAQGAVINGTVTNEDGEALGGATVVVGTTIYGAVTSPTGSYTITIPGTAVRGQQVVLTARAVGYRPETATLTLSAGTQEQNFTLRADPLRLEELIVTGVSEATSTRKLPFTIGKVSEAQLQEVPGSSALVAMQGKIAGVRLIPTSSQPGGEVAVRLRGATSISARQDPIFIVDGVIVRYGLADISSEDVERIEVIKGAAASALYGANAANGVVQVFTKRGSSLPDGKLQVTARFEGGVNYMPRRLEFSRSHAFQVDAQGNYILSATGSRQTKANQIADNPFPVYYDHWDALVDPGLFWTGYLSVGQRRGSTNFNASVQNTDNEGVIFGLGGYARQNFRLNLDQQISSNIDASFSTFYGTSTNGRAEEGQGGPFFGLMFLQPDVDITAPAPDGTPFNPVVPLSGDIANDFNPMYELANRKIQQDRNRFNGSARVRWRPSDWLSAEGSFGYDQEGQFNSDLTPFGYQTSSGTKTQGSLLKGQVNSRSYTSGVTLTSIRNFTSDIRNTTKVGASFSDEHNRALTSTAGALIVARVPEFAGSEVASQRAFSTDERFRSQNFYAITTFDIQDKYILDGLVRRDGSSLFGPGNRYATYYRLSGAWRANEDLKIPGIDELRLRASYGTAGLWPSFNDQYEILTVTAGGFTKETLGNPNLKPARSSELEVGANLEFGGGRYTVEYTYARKETKDQILLVDLPSVVGFKQQWQNTGALESKTHEAAIAAQVINNRNASLTLTVVGDRTRQVITDWTIPERLYSFQQMPAAFFLGKGSNLGVIFGNRWIRNIDELYDDPAKKAASGPGQAHDPARYMINEDGYVVLKSAYGTLNERAIKYTYCKKPDAQAPNGCAITSQTVQIGDANPDFNMSFGATLNYRRLVLNGLLDWSYGADLYNGTRQWAFQATRDKVQDQAGKPEAAKKPAGYYAVGFYNGLDPSDYFIENGTYAKLKELSVNYTFVQDQLRKVGLGGLTELRLGLIGRNLFTITDYSGMDPEVSGLFGDPFQVRMDWFQYPQFRTFTAVVEIAF